MSNHTEQSAETTVRRKDLESHPIGRYWKTSLICAEHSQVAGECPVCNAIAETQRQAIEESDRRNAVLLEKIEMLEATNEELRRECGAI